MAGAVAVGSGSGSPWGAFRTGRPAPGALLFVLAAALILGVTGAWSVALLRARRHSGPASVGELLRSVNPRRVFPGAVVAVALIGLLGISSLDLATVPPTGVARSHGGGNGQGRPLEILDNRSSSVRAGGAAAKISGPSLLDRPTPAIAALVILLVGGAALTWWWMGRRSGKVPEDSDEEIDTEAARGTVLRSIEAMLADPDPNTAVIGAYARLLEGLAASGAPRRDYEGPVEHLRRALTHLPVRPGPVRRLVELFEVARFSTQTLTLEHRDQALGALHEVAYDLGHKAAGVSETARVSPGGAGP